MSIRFRCTNPACGKTVKAPNDAVGKRAKCPRCGQKLTVPSPGEATKAAKAPKKIKPAETYDLADSTRGPSPMAEPMPGVSVTRSSRPGAAVAAAPKQAKAEEIMCPVCGTNYVKGTFCPECRARREAAHKKASPWGKVIGGVVMALVIVVIAVVAYLMMGK